MTPTSLIDEMSQSYLIYSCSIFNRSLPNIIDGLKTAQRRILLGLKDLHLYSDTPFKKVSRLEGHVLGSYHPNGGCAGTAINMGQCNAFRYPLTNIHGNVGGSIQIGEKLGQSLDESPPAAARYLEIKSTKMTDVIYLSECDKIVSNWRPNYDGSTEEIEYFVPKLPALLLNGATGIATGFACNHLPYHAHDVIDATIALIKNPQARVSKYIKIPEFPHHVRVLNKNLEQVVETGEGTLSLYGDWEIKQVSYKKKSKRQAICISSLGAGNSERFIDLTHKAIEEEKVVGIAEITNLSSRHGIEIEIILKANTNPQEVLNKLLKHTNLSANFSVNATGLIPNEPIPKKFGVRDIILEWYNHRINALRKRFTHEIKEIQERLEILDGLLICLANTDEVIAIIKTSQTKSEAQEKLKKIYALTDLQIKAILDLNLKSLINQEVLKIKSEQQTLSIKLEQTTKLLQDKQELDKHIINELLSLKQLFDKSRRTRVIEKDPTTHQVKNEDELNRLKNWAIVTQKMPTHGKKSWNFFIKGKEGLSIEDLKKEVKLWLTS